MVLIILIESIIKVISLMDAKIDYFVLTLWDQKRDPVSWGHYVLSLFGLEFHQEAYGRRGYKDEFTALYGAKYWSIPHDGTNRITISLPGEACSFLGFEALQSAYKWAITDCDKVTCNRIDLAIDEVEFTPRMVYDFIMAGEVRSLVKRDSLAFWTSQEKNDFGVNGCSAVTFGSRSSMRYLRIYDKHGYTRVEVEYKHERADLVAKDIFGNEDGEHGEYYEIYKISDDNRMLDKAISHLRDMVDIFADWWFQFVGVIERAGATLPKISSSLKSFQKWVLKALPGVLAYLHDVQPELMDCAKIKGRLFLDTKPIWQVRKEELQWLAI